MKKNFVLIIAIILTTSFSALADWGPFGSLVNTQLVNNITQSTADVSGSVSLLVTDPDVTTRGFCWSTTSNPTTADTKTVENGSFRSGSYSANITSLLLNKTYYVKAYATNTDGTYYGEQIAFTTVPTLPEWGLISMASLIAVFGGWFVWKKVV